MDMSQVTVTAPCCAMWSDKQCHPASFQDTTSCRQPDLPALYKSLPRPQCSCSNCRCYTYVSNCRCYTYVVHLCWTTILQLLLLLLSTISASAAATCSFCCCYCQLSHAATAPLAIRYCCYYCCSCCTSLLCRLLRLIRLTAAATAVSRASLTRNVSPERGLIFPYCLLNPFRKPRVLNSTMLVKESGCSRT